jgi:hypothetical protein
MPRSARTCRSTNASRRCADIPGSATSPPRCARSSPAGLYQCLEQGIVQEADVAAAGLAVRSDHFRVQIAVALGPLEYTLYSWLQRNDNGASRVLRRARVAY